MMRFQATHLSCFVVGAILLTTGCGRAPTPKNPVGWPAIFGPYESSLSNESLDTGLIAARGPVELWRQEVGIGYSSPVTANGRVILQHRIDDEEIIACFDLETGKPLWEHRYPTTYKCRYEYSDGPYGTPRIHDGKVYTFGAQWQARCLELATGEVVWQRDLSEGYQVEEGLFGFGPGTVIDQGRLIFNLGAADAGVIALDAATGETLWTSGEDRAGYATPRVATMHGQRYAFVQTFEGLQALDPATGEQRFFVKFTNTTPDSVTATSPVVWDDKLLLVTGPGPGALCLRVTPEGGYEQVWKDRRAIDSQWNTLMRAGDIVYGFTSKRLTTSFRAVDLNEGEVLWSWTTDLERGTGLRTDDTFILWGEHGHLAFVGIDPEKEELLWMTESPLLESPTYSSPALDGGLLLLRNEGTLLCLSLRHEELAN